MAPTTRPEGDHGEVMEPMTATLSSPTTIVLSGLKRPAPDADEVFSTSDAHCPPADSLTFVLCVCKALRVALLAEETLWQEFAVSDTSSLSCSMLHVDDAGLLKLLSLA